MSWAFIRSVLALLTLLAAIIITVKVLRRTWHKSYWDRFYDIGDLSVLWALVMLALAILDRV